MANKSKVNKFPARLVRVGIFALLMAFGVTAAAAQGSGGASAAAKARPRSAGSGDYYIEFRSRYAWDYGHTYMIHARVGERVTKANVAGLSPVGDDPTAWVIGHYVPVPAETGATDGDIEEKYVTARFRVYMGKAEYDRVVAHIKEMQASSHVWSAELYNCNAFAGDVASFMGLKVPASSLIYPKVYVTHLRELNTGDPKAADTLISDNVKEMSNPTRDGRAMINNGIYVVHNGTYSARTVREPASPKPNVIIGPVRISNSAAGAVATSAPSP